LVNLSQFAQLQLSIILLVLFLKRYKINTTEPWWTAYYANLVHRIETFSYKNCILAWDRIIGLLFLVDGYFNIILSAKISVGLNMASGNIIYNLSRS